MNFAKGGLRAKPPGATCIVTGGWETSLSRGCLKKVHFFFGKTALFSEGGAEGGPSPETLSLLLLRHQALKRLQALPPRLQALRRSTRCATTRSPPGAARSNVFWPFTRHGRGFTPPAGLSPPFVFRASPKVKPRRGTTGAETSQTADLGLQFSKLRQGWP